MLIFQPAVFEPTAIQPHAVEGTLRQIRDACMGRNSFSGYPSRAPALWARFKRREYVRIMLRDVLRIAPLAETTAEISTLSDVLIEEALREAESAMERRHGLPQHLDSAGRAVNTPFAVLSLGKLGGNELN